jgi:HAD superfamily hydrolase (TIGR01493 family)
MQIKCIAFDCFGTVFDMSTVPKSEIAAYVEHVKRADFSPYQFPFTWNNLKAHPDAAEGIYRLQKAGFLCVTLSNGTADLLKQISDSNGIAWTAIINLAAHRVYKQHIDAYRVVEKVIGFSPAESLMVTANPTFGDIEGAAAIEMPSQVIRHGYPNTIIELADMLATKRNRDE